jgi:hypothetical protein
LARRKREQALLPIDPHWDSGSLLRRWKQKNEA